MVVGTSEGADLPSVVLLHAPQPRPRVLDLLCPRLRLALLLLQHVLQAAELGSLLGHGLLHCQYRGLQALKVLRAQLF